MASEPQQRRRRPNGDGSRPKFRAKQNRWHQRLTLGGRPVDVYGHTQSECIENGRKRRADFERTGLTLTDKTTYGAWLLGYFLPEVVLAGENRPSSKAATARAIRLYLAPSDLGQKPMVQVTKADCQRCINAAAAKGAAGQPLARATARRILIVMKQSFGRAHEENLIPTNPAAGLGRGTIPRREKYKADPLVEEELVTFLKVIDGDPDELAYWVDLCLGLRIGELLGLTWTAIDFEAKTLRVHQSIQRVEGKLAIYALKTDDSEAIIPLADALIPMLKAHRVRQLQRRLAAGDQWARRVIPVWDEGNYRAATPEERDLVFTNHVGDPRDRSSLYHCWQRRLTTAKIRVRALKNLRHTCALMLITLGYDLQYVKQVLRHSTIQVTSDSYLHLKVSILAEPVDKAGQKLHELKARVAKAGPEPTGVNAGVNEARTG